MKKALPLEGLRVIELATVVAAPTAARLLADYGAEVIKIEIPGAGDSLRIVGDMHQMPIEPDNNPLFDAFNTGKRLLGLNLKSAEGMEILFKLLEGADVFLTNTRMRSLEKMGLGYEALKERFPRLIYAHFSGFGLDGPEKDRPGFDSTAFWLRPGTACDMVLPGDFPARPPYAFGDIATASYFLNGILMAVIGRERTGRGTLVSTSLYGAGIWMSSPYVINTQAKYGKQLPSDRYDPWNPFSDIYECSDGVYIAPISKRYPSDRPMLAKVFDMPELLDDPELFSISSMRKAGKLPAVTRKLAQTIKKRSSTQWAEIFEQVDMAYELSRHIRDIPDDEQALANGFVEPVDYPDGKTFMPTPPVKYSEYSRRAFEKQGRIGADTDGILTELGYGLQEIARLKNEQVLE